MTKRKQGRDETWGKRAREDCAELASLLKVAVAAAEAEEAGKDQGHSRSLWLDVSIVHWE